MKLSQKALFILKQTNLNPITILFTLGLISPITAFGYGSSYGAIDKTYDCKVQLESGKTDSILVTITRESRIWLKTHTKFETPSIKMKIKGADLFGQKQNSPLLDLFQSQTEKTAQYATYNTLSPESEVESFNTEPLNVFDFNEGHIITTTNYIDNKFRTTDMVFRKLDSDNISIEVHDFGAHFNYYVSPNKESQFELKYSGICNRYLILP